MPFISIDRTLTILQHGGLVVQNPEGNVWVVDLLRHGKQREYHRIGGLSVYTFRFFKRYGVIREVPEGQRIGRGCIEYVIARRNDNIDDPPPDGKGA